MNQSKQKGFSFPEVMIGVFIFAVGMLALGSLQVSLTRSEADANSRAVASSIAQRMIERVQGFANLASGGDVPSYADITEAALKTAGDNDGPTVGLGGLTYTITPNVIDWRWDGASSSFKCYQDEFENAGDARCDATKPAGVGTFSDMKMIELTVSWNGTTEFATGDGSSISSGDMNTGEITVSGIVSSVTTPAAGKVQNSGGEIGLPPISYTPGANPDVVSLSLGSSRFKEATRPEPVINKGQGETTWDVVTYATGDAGSTFLRREEFRAVACTCEFAAAGDALEPVFWGGDEYVDGATVSKMRGSNVDSGGNSTVNSRLCDRCCENHHDKSSNGYQRFRPFDVDVNGDGNHLHYNVNNQGSLEVVAETAGNEYLEACRMVRVNGFWRVAQDLRNEQTFIVPDEWLDNQAEIDDYSDYIVGTDADDSRDGAVEKHFDAITTNNSGYSTTMPCWGDTTGCLATPVYNVYPNSLADGEFPAWTSVDISSFNQLRTRGLYIDHMHPDLIGVVECLEGDNTIDEIKAKNGCSIGEKIGYASDADNPVVVLDQFTTANALEIMPFFEIQLTSLNVWSAISPIDVTSDAISSRGFSRGLATARTTGAGEASANTRQGNMSLLDETPYLPTTVAPEIVSTLDTRGVDNGAGGGDPGGGGGFKIGGIITIPKFAAIGLVTSSATAENCSVGGTWACNVFDFTVPPVPSVTIEMEYTKSNNIPTYTLCSPGGLNITTVTKEPGYTVATVTLSVNDDAPASLEQNLVVVTGACP